MYLGKKMKKLFFQKTIYHFSAQPDQSIFSCIPNPRAEFLKIILELFSFFWPVFFHIVSASPL